MAMDEPTLFTKIIRGEIPSSKVAEGDLWYAFLDIYPRRAGHTLVVPKEQAQRVAALSPESRQALRAAPQEGTASPRLLRSRCRP